jgi:hypothetical protein
MVHNGESGNGKITKANNPYISDSIAKYYHESTYIFENPVSLTRGTKYVVEIVMGKNIGAYVKIGENIYDKGPAYDINGSNHHVTRQIPMKLYKG